ncbi:MAG: hypothetical protein ACE5SW_11030, partial [Nitrososphaeraceae archaeon]
YDNKYEEKYDEGYDNKYEEKYDEGYDNKYEEKFLSDFIERKFYNFDEKRYNKLHNQGMKIPQIYETALDGSIYKFNRSTPNGKIQVDEEKNDNIFTHKNDDGSWTIDYGSARIDIFTRDAGVLDDDSQILQKNIYDSIVQSWSFSDLEDVGYWYKPSDWKNIEFTLIFKLLDSSRSDSEEHDISLVTRSISHSESYNKKSDKTPFYCGGSSYHNNISNKGNLQMKKEEFHANYEIDKNNPNVSLGNIYDKIIGFKGIVYNLNDTAVKLESWVDTENQGKGPYKKVHEKIDNGNWGDSMTVCGAETDGQAITWGSPMVIVKANDFKFNIYDIEVREIIPPII